MVGKVISHYRIEEKLGEGGMGVVYRARDLSLPRNAAVKFLSREIATEEQRRRFQQEAQAASSLNHPNILAVYEAGTEEGQQYLITEFVDGVTLREWVRRERPSLRQMLELMTGIADALACAHEAAIVHRDVKPENILIARQGYAKLADFGVAKLADGATAEGETRLTPVKHTRTGAIVGTVPYMAPEQISGGLVDARVDIFAFGAVLYELVAGCHPFEGKTDADVLHAILRLPPKPIADLRADTPAPLRFALEKALEKDPADRYQTMREFVVDLKRCLRAKPSEQEAAPLRAVVRRRWLPSAVAIAVATGLAVAALTIWRLRPSEAPAPNPLEGAKFTRLTDFEGTELDAEISNDGRFVVFVSDRDGPFDAWVTQVGTGQFVNLTKGRVPELLADVNRNVGFFYDGAEVWLRAQTRGADGKLLESRLLRIPTLGGAPQPFLDPGVNMASSPDGSKIVYHGFAVGDPMFVADRTGSNPRQIYIANAGIHCHYPAWSADGQFIYFVRGIPPGAMDVWRIAANGGEAERLTFHNSKVGYPAPLDDRTLLYVATAEDASGSWLYTLDLQRRRSRRASFGVEQYISISAGAPAPGRPRRLAATVANPSVNLWSVPVTEHVVDETGATRVSVPTVRASAPRFGPDSILYLSSKGGGEGLWKFQDEVASELWNAANGAVAAAPAVSPDGSHVCFPVRQQGRVTLYVMNANGTGRRQLAESLDVRGAPSWSPDGRWLAVAADDEKNGPRVFKVPVDGQAPVRLVDSLSLNPAWSPDGRFIVYAGPDQGGQFPLKAVTPDKQPYPLPELFLRRGAERFCFLPKSHTLVTLQGEFWNRQQDFWLIDLDTHRQRQLTRLRPGSLIAGFDVSPDGRQIIFDRARDNADIVLIDLPPR